MKVLRSLSLKPKNYDWVLRSTFRCNQSPNSADIVLSPAPLYNLFPAGLVIFQFK